MVNASRDKFRFGRIRWAKMNFAHPTLALLITFQINSSAFRAMRYMGILSVSFALPGLWGNEH